MVTLAAFAWAAVQAGAAPKPPGNDANAMDSLNAELNAVDARQGFEGDLEAAQTKLGAARLLAEQMARLVAGNSVSQEVFEQAKRDVALAEADAALCRAEAHFQSATEKLRQWWVSGYRGLNADNPPLRPFYLDLWRSKVEVAAARVLGAKATLHYALFRYQMVRDLFSQQAESEASWIEAKRDYDVAVSQVRTWEKRQQLANDAKIRFEALPESADSAAPALTASLKVSSES